MMMHNTMLEVTFARCWLHDLPQRAWANTLIHCLQLVLLPCTYGSIPGSSRLHIHVYDNHAVVHCTSKPCVVVCYMTVQLTYSVLPSVCVCQTQTWHCIALSEANVGLGQFISCLLCQLRCRRALLLHVYGYTIFPNSSWFSALLL